MNDAPLTDPRYENYLDVYKCAHRLIDELVKAECGEFVNDSSMETLTQTCLIAHDPCLYVNPNAVEYPLDVTEIKARLERDFPPPIPTKRDQDETCEERQKEIRYLLEGVPHYLSWDERRIINFTIFYYFGAEGIPILKHHWIVEDRAKLARDLNSQLMVQGITPRDNYLKSKSANHKPAKNTVPGFSCATPSNVEFPIREDKKSARTEVFAEIDKFFKIPKTTVIKAPCGIGKSTYTVQMLAQISWQTKVLYLAPTHALVKEIREQLIAVQKKQKKGRFQFPPSHIYGRSSVDTHGFEVCDNRAVKEYYQEKGVPIPQSECFQCHMNPCRYITQFDDLSNIRFATHADLRNAPSNWENGSSLSDLGGFHVPKNGNWKPDMVIVDESFITTGAKELTSNSAHKSLRNIVKAVREGVDLFAAVQNHQDEVKDDYKNLNHAIKEAANSTGEKYVEKRLMFSSAEEAFLRAFHHALNPQNGPKALLSIGPDKRRNPTRLLYNPLPQVHERFSKTPILVFDATAQMELIQHILSDAEFVEINAKPREGFKVHQCQNVSFSKAGFGKDEQLFDRLVKDIDSKINLHKPKRIGLISYKSIGNDPNSKLFPERIADALAFEGDAVTGYFGNIRGLNKFNECDLFFVVGNYRLHESGLAIFTQQITGSNNVDLQMASTPLPQRYRETDSADLVNYTYTSAETRRVADAFGAAETIQAIFRARQFSGLEKTVYYYSNAALGSDVSADEFFDFPTEKLMTVMGNLKSKGFCPIKPASLKEIGFSSSQSESGRRAEIIAQLKNRGVKTYRIDYRKNGTSAKMQCLVWDLGVLRADFAMKKWKIENEQQLF